MGKSLLEGLVLFIAASARPGTPSWGRALCLVGRLVPPGDVCEPRSHRHPHRQEARAHHCEIGGRRNFSHEARELVGIAGGRWCGGLATAQDVVGRWGLLSKLFLGTPQPRVLLSCFLARRPPMAPAGPKRPLPTPQQRVPLTERFLGTPAAHGTGWSRTVCLLSLCC